MGLELIEQHDQPVQKNIMEATGKHSAAEGAKPVSDNSNRPPGIYAYHERMLSDDQLLAAALAVRSSPEIWDRFSKIKSNEGIEEQFSRDVRGVIINHLVSNNLVMSGSDLVATFRLLRAMAEKDRSGPNSSESE
jgi:hypothetical protein